MEWDEMFSFSHRISLTMSLSHSHALSLRLSYFLLFSSIRFGVCRPIVSILKIHYSLDAIIFYRQIDIREANENKRVFCVCVRFFRLYTTSRLVSRLVWVPAGIMFKQVMFNIFFTTSPISMDIHYHIITNIRRIYCSILLGAHVFSTSSINDSLYSLSFSLSLARLTAWNYTHETFDANCTNAQHI